MCHLALRPTKLIISQKRFPAAIGVDFLLLRSKPQITILLCSKSKRSLGRLRFIEEFLSSGE